MEIDFATCGKVIVNMKNHFEEKLDDLPTDMDGMAVTPVASHQAIYR